MADARELFVCRPTADPLDAVFELAPEDDVLVLEAVRALLLLAARLVERVVAEPLSII